MAIEFKRSHIKDFNSRHYSSITARYVKSADQIIDKTETALKFAKAVIQEAIDPANEIVVGDVGAWKDGLEEINETLQLLDE